MVDLLEDEPPEGWPEPIPTPPLTVEGAQVALTLTPFQIVTLRFHTG